MKLIKFRVEGFRCLESIDWISLQNLTLFTGQNDGGKTSTIDAMDVFLNRRQVPEENDFTFIDNENQCEEIVLEGVFELSSNERGEVDFNEDTIYIRKTCANDFTSRYSYKTKVHPDQRLQRDLNSVTVDELKEIADDYTIPLSQRRAKSPIVREIQEWLNTQELSEGFLELPSKFIDKFPSMKIFRSARTLNPENEINQTLSASFSSRIQTSKYSGRLTRIQNDIEEDLRSDLKDFEAIALNYCPDLIGIDIEPSFDFSRGFRTSRLRIRKPDGTMDLEKEGEGRKRRITLAVYEWREKILSGIAEEQIIAFDEPDTHLDYFSQRKILDIIRRISDDENSSSIVCTHSLNLIDRIPITDIVHFKRVDERTVIEILQTDDAEVIDLFLYEISESMGLKNSIMLNERCFLVVEGDTEMCSLPIMFKKIYDLSPQACGVRLLNGEGCGGVKSLAKFLNENKRNVIFLLDKGSQADPNYLFTPEKLENDGFTIEEQVFFVGTYEFEDSFSDEIYVRAANKFWPKPDGTPWTNQEFTNLRTSTKFSNELVNLLRRVTRTNISKTKIGVEIAKAIETHEVPKDIVECLQQTYALAN